MLFFKKKKKKERAGLRLLSSAELGIPSPWSSTPWQSRLPKSCVIPELQCLRIPFHWDTFSTQTWMVYMASESQDTLQSEQKEALTAITQGISKRCTSVTMAYFCPMA